MRGDDGEQPERAEALEKRPEPRRPPLAPYVPDEQRPTDGQGDQRPNNGSIHTLGNLRPVAYPRPTARLQGPSI